MTSCDVRRDVYQVFIWLHELKTNDLSMCYTARLFWESTHDHSTRPISQPTPLHPPNTLAHDNFESLHPPQPDQNTHSTEENTVCFTCKQTSVPPKLKSIPCARAEKHNGDHSTHNFIPEIYDPCGKMPKHICAILMRKERKSS